MVRQMTDEHRAANAKARDENRAVDEYLDALEAHRPRPGRRRSAESMRKRLDSISTALESARPRQRLELVQERIDLEQQIVSDTQTVDISNSEETFVEIAVAYSGRKGITYPAWREIGVPAAVLQRAGIARQ